ncbi:cysteine hydrolase family protein [Pusillimonas sp. ANT_WB101]|uniref:cysteine hydrolase family protein n=1 Tax=Pusillimonas sp. ANT_WB101 TaxID=2597356 RepID=UPI0011EE78AF|nr:isochorismatase family cysteine hydrolase [Pusillimonas sp. ANT_WB101]KAA0911314.1 cysteine hydrolase [Pusillimonas sp. ANT_WB101]
MSTFSVNRSHQQTLPAGISAGMPLALTLEEQLVRQKSALLVIDMQNDFVSEQGLLARRGLDLMPQRQVIDNINRLVRVAREAGVLVIWVQTSHSFAEALSNYLSVHLRNLPRERWVHDELLVSEGSEGAQWHESIISRLPDEPLLTKNMYSAFRGTSLTQILDAHQVRSLVLAGVNTDVCIHSTATDAFFDGYYPVLCEDACATSTRETHEAILRTHRTFYGLTATLSDIEKLWAATPQ